MHTVTGSAGGSLTRSDRGGGGDRVEAVRAGGATVRGGSLRLSGGGGDRVAVEAVRGATHHSGWQCSGSAARSVRVTGNTVTVAAPTRPAEPASVKDCY